MTELVNKKLTVGELREAIAGIPDSTPVVIEIDNAEDCGDLAQATLRLANVEARCDEVDRLYLWGSFDEDRDDLENE